jgi:dTDP-4-amino-4,6-dideoxygalactose transaminase
MSDLRRKDRNPIRLVKPDIPEEALRSVVDVIKSGHLVQGEYVKKFERALQDYLGARNVILVSSGTAALHLSLMALGLQKDDEVIVPTFTFPATANVVEVVGGKPVLVDVKLDDFCIDVARIEKAITRKTKAIMPVHEFGQPAEMGRIMEIAKKHRLDVIEDAACALGAEFNRKKVGTFGRVGCFSLHPRKMITTGEGGILVTDDDVLAERVRSLRNHGLSASGRGFDLTYAGLNYRMTDFQAALGLSQLSDIDRFTQAREQVVQMYQERLSGIGWIKTPRTFEKKRSIYQTYHLLLEESIDRDRLITSLKEEGIETNLGAYALNCLSYYQRKYGYDGREYPNAVRAYRKGLAVPIGAHVNKEEIDYIVGALKTKGEARG